MANKPSLLLVVECAMLVARLVAVTVAPGTTASVESTTEPTIEPVETWARSDALLPSGSSKRMIISSLARLIELFMVECLSNATGTSESHQRRERLSKEPGGKLDFEDL